ncbi:hypothetical protein ABE525_12355 [Pseudomonas wadenswilerensis]|uniref:hypothetical protein n=1 Tax=Pseudomonas TaxID=286 RepID=UPI0005797EB2|nr:MULTISPECIES: hypothetical protein [Pseudomonas]
MLLILLSVIAATQAVAQDWSKQAIRVEHSTDRLARLHDKIQSQGTAALKDIASQVEWVISVNSSSEPNSIYNAQGRKVEIPDAFVARTINLARMATLATQSGELNCIARYRKHMDRTGSRTVPEKYLEQTGADCSAMRARLPLGALQEARAEQELDATLEFAYLHELGHQYHNHYRVPLPPDVATPQHQCDYLRIKALYRAMEYEADDFAVDALASLGDSAIVLSMANMWLPEPVDPDPGNIARSEMLSQRLSEHPVSILRYIRVLDRTSGVLARQPNVNPEILQIIQQFIDVQKRAEQFIAESDEELSPC